MEVEISSFTNSLEQFPSISEMDLQSPEEFYWPESEPQIVESPGNTQLQLLDLSKFVCTICGDHASGTNYGALSCNGCRSFFRRTVLTGAKYVCMKGNGNCSLTVKQRSSCKACRFDTCMKAGMKPGDVTNPKKPRMDSLSPPLVHVGVDNSSIVIRSTQTLSISNLLESYYSSCSVAQSVVEIPQVDGNIMASDWSTFVKSDHLAVHAHLLMMVEWAKRIQGFRDLTMDDQVALLRSFGGKHVCLQGAFESSRSPQDHIEGNLVFGFGKVTLPLHSQKLENFMEAKALNETCRSLATMTIRFTRLLKEAEVKDEEFICFQSLLLLDPSVQGLSDSKKVMEIRRNIQSIVMAEKGMNPNIMFRIMDLFHLLPVLNDLSVTSVMVTKESDYYAPVGKCSKLVEDLYLASEM